MRRFARWCRRSAGLRPRGLSAPPPPRARSASTPPRPPQPDAQRHGVRPALPPTPTTCSGTRRPKPSGADYPSTAAGGSLRWRRVDRILLVAPRRRRRLVHYQAEAKAPAWWLQDPPATRRGSRTPSRTSPPALRPHPVLPQQACAPGRAGDTRHSPAPPNPRRRAGTTPPRRRDPARPPHRPPSPAARARRLPRGRNPRGPTGADFRARPRPKTPAPSPPGRQGSGADGRWTSAAP